MTLRCLAMLAVVSVASVARADAIGGPPTSCPRGANGTASHAGAWCTPVDCSAATNCTDAMRSWASPTPPAPGQYTCQQRVGLCVRTQTVPAGGMVQGSMITKREAVSACRTASDCPADAPCELAARCAEDPSWTSPASPASRTFWQRAFSCDGGGPPTQEGGLLLGLGGLAVATVLVRRRR